MWAVSSSNGLRPRFSVASIRSRFQNLGTWLCVSVYISSKLKLSSWLPISLYFYKKEDTSANSVQWITGHWPHGLGHNGRRLKGGAHPNTKDLGRAFNADIGKVPHRLPRKKHACMAVLLRQPKKSQRKRGGNNPHATTIAHNRWHSQPYSSRRAGKECLTGGFVMQIAVLLATIRLSHPQCQPRPRGLSAHGLHVSASTLKVQAKTRSAQTISVKA